MSKTTPETFQLIQTLVPRRNVRWGTIVLFWLALGLVSALHWWYFYFGQQPYTWWVLLRAKVLVWGLWGVATPFILWLGARFRLARPHLVRNSAVLTLFSIVVSVVYIGLYAAAVRLNFPPEFPAAPGGFWKLAHWIYWNHFSYFYLGYWVVIAVEQMLGFARRSYERDAVARELEKQLAEARLAQLKAQIQPHFLFNTLNAISSLIVESEKDRAYEMVSRLSHLLRVGLEHGDRQQVTLADEMAFVEEYLTLMSLRFGDRMETKVSVDAHVRKALVPSLILQPLVENAVKFGTGADSGLTTVSVEAVSKDGRLNITIANSSSPLSGNTKVSENEGFGLGLANTRDRLNYLYGNGYSLELEHPSPGTSVLTLNIPLSYKHE